MHVHFHAHLYHPRRIFMLILTHAFSEHFHNKGKLDAQHDSIATTCHFAAWPPKLFQSPLPTTAKDKPDPTAINSIPEL